MENTSMVSRGRQRIHFWHIVILVTVVALSYGHIGSFDFLYLWDDQWQVINDRTSGGITGSNLKTIFATSEYGQYSPINQLYYTAIYLFGGYNPRWFHWGSVLLHTLNTVLVYYMGYRLLCSLVYSRKVSLYCALIASLLVAIHPVNVEAVCWVSASKVLLGCFFYYLSILAYCKYVCTGRKSFFVIGIAFAFLSAGSKEQVVTLAVCLLLIDRYVFGRSLSSWGGYAEKLYYLLPAVCIFLVTMWANRHVPETTVGYNLPERLLFGFNSLFGYIQSSLFPFRLSYLYPFPYTVGEDITLWLWIYPGVIFFIGYLLYQNRSSRLLCFCSLYFVLQLLPVLHIVPLPRYFIMADRYLYMPYAVVALLVGVGIYKVYESRRRWAWVLFVFYFGYLACYTRSYSLNWRNSTVLKQDVSDILKQREKQQLRLEN